LRTRDDSVSPPPDLVQVATRQELLNPSISNVQEKEFGREYSHGYAAVKHQRFGGTGYFDQGANTIAAGASSIAALRGSTEEAQFADLKLPERVIPLGEDPSCRSVPGECPLVESCRDERDAVSQRG
jgi:hypothetical protein